MTGRPQSQPFGAHGRGLRLNPVFRRAYSGLFTAQDTWIDERGTQTGAPAYAPTPVHPGWKFSGPTRDATASNTFFALVNNAGCWTVTKPQKQTARKNGGGWDIWLTFHSGRRTGSPRPCHVLGKRLRLPPPYNRCRPRTSNETSGALCGRLARQRRLSNGGVMRQGSARIRF